MKRSAPREKSDRAAAGRCRRLVDHVFAALPPSERDSVAREVETRHVVVVDASPNFTQRTTERATRRELRKALGSLKSDAWRRHHHLDDFGGFQVEKAFVETLHRAWLEAERPVLERLSKGVSLDVVKSLDWHGAKIRVASARNPRCVGIAGIVFARTLLELCLVDEADKKWRIDKDGTSWDLLVNDETLRVDGALVFEEDIQRGKRRRRKQTRKRAREKE